MEFSVNQLLSEVRKALLGKGFAYGFADDVARAIEWLASHNIIPEDEMIKLLNAPEEGMPNKPVLHDNRMTQDQPAGIKDVIACFDLADAFGCDEVHFAALIYPRLSAALAYLRGAPHCGRFASLDGQSLSDFITGHRLSQASKTDQVTLAFGRRAFSQDPAPHWPARLQISSGLCDLLSHYAYRTYVPSSDQSRTAGAGAGLNDND